jgi:hypothetical protein
MGNGRHLLQDIANPWFSDLLRMTTLSNFAVARLQHCNLVFACVHAIGSTKFANREFAGEEADMDGRLVASRTTIKVTDNDHGRPL